jgi:hypothetical protein
MSKQLRQTNSIGSFSSKRLSELSRQRDAGNAFSLDGGRNHKHHDVRHEFHLVGRNDEMTVLLKPSLALRSSTPSTLSFISAVPGGGKSALLRQLGVLVSHSLGHAQHMVKIDASELEAHTSMSLFRRIFERLFQDQIDRVSGHVPYEARAKRASRRAPLLYYFAHFANSSSTHFACRYSVIQELIEENGITESDISVISTTLPFIHLPEHVGANKRRESGRTTLNNKDGLRTRLANGYTMAALTDQTHAVMVKLLMYVRAKQAQKRVGRTCARSHMCSHTRARVHACAPS